MNKKEGLTALIVVLLSLAGILVWQLLLSDFNNYILSVAILMLSMVPFFVSFEARYISPRELTLIATLIALAVASRAAFYFVPQFKPIAAVVIVSAVCLGAERGYMVGAFSAFISNFIFGQGYWTPFQMVALGTIGLIAGCVFKVIKPRKLNLAVIGFLLAFAVYGLIVDSASVLIMYDKRITLSGALAVYGAGLPFSAVFGVATALFLFVFGEAFIKKINRVKIKYSLLTINDSVI